MGFDALQSCVVSASTVLWLTVDPRWGAAAGVGFPSRVWAGKTATSLQGERGCSMALWRGLLGVNAKNSHVLGLDESGLIHWTLSYVAISIGRVPCWK